MIFFILSFGFVYDEFPEIFALVPTNNPHFSNNFKVHLESGILTAIFLSNFSDFFNFLSVNFKINVNGPGQYFFMIFSVNESIHVISFTISYEYANTGYDFIFSLDLIS